MKKSVRKLALLMAALMTAGSLAACSGSVSGGVAKYGSDVISEQEAEFWLRYEEWFTEGYYWDLYAAYGYENMWQAGYSETQTYGEYFHENIMREILQTRILADHAADYGIAELTDAQKAKVDENVATIMENELFTKHFSATSEQVTEFLTLNAKAVLVIEAVKDAAEVEINDDEVNKYAIQYIMVSEPEEEEETEEAAEETEAAGTEETAETLEGEELANQILKEAQDGADMEAIADAHEGLYCSDSSYLLTGETSTAITYTESAQMAAGEIRLVKNDSSWYVIKKLDDFNEEATESARTTLIDEKKTEAFNTLYTEWAEKAPKFVVDETKWAKYTVSEKIYETAAETEEAAETEAETETEAE